ncbi:peptidylprolyl isomerase, partial [bacterium]|nr:peptidylprolyl isomerase [bacterium]
PFLDGQYSVFGEAITGLDVVDAIVSADTDGNDRPREDQRIESVTVEEWDGDQVQAALSALAKEGR